MTALAEEPWSQTASGSAFPLLAPTPERVYWPDIIFSLAHVNRFNGHVGQYSVAQHSVLVADQLLPQWRLYGLLHDAHEAFVGDVPTPIKEALKEYQSLWALESIVHDIDQAIYAAAGLLFPVPMEIAEAVKVADMRVCMTERRDLMAPPPQPWGEEYERLAPLPETITKWSPQQAIARFSAALAGCGLNVPPMSFVA